MGVLILLFVFIIYIITTDILSYQPLTLENGAAGVARDDEIFIVYQDFKYLFSSIEIVKWNTSNDKAEIKTMVSGEGDYIKPQIYLAKDGFIISWFFVNEHGNRFEYAFLKDTNWEINIEQSYNIDMNLENLDYDKFIIFQS